MWTKVSFLPIFLLVVESTSGKRKWADPAYQRSFLTKISAVLKVKEVRIPSPFHELKSPSTLFSLLIGTVWAGKRFHKEEGRGFSLNTAPWQTRFSEYFPSMHGRVVVLPKKVEELRLDFGKIERIFSYPSLKQKRYSTSPRYSNLFLPSKSKIYLEQPEDWYSVTLSDLKKAGFTAKIGKLQLGQLLGKKYPHHKWEKVYLLRGKYAQQHRLEQAVSTLFTVLWSLVWWPIGLSNMLFKIREKT